MTGPGIVALLLAAVVVGLLWTAPSLVGRPIGTRCIGILLGVDTGLVLIGGIALAAAAGRSWSLVGDPIDPARTAHAILQVTQTDGDADLYALLVIVIALVTMLATIVLGSAARSVAPGRSASDRAVVTSVLWAQVAISGAAFGRLATGSTGLLYVVLAAHLPLSAGALWLQHRRHRQLVPRLAPR